MSFIENFDIRKAAEQSFFQHQNGRQPTEEERVGNDPDHRKIKPFMDQELSNLFAKQAKENSKPTTQYHIIGYSKHINFKHWLSTKNQIDHALKGIIHHYVPIHQMQADSYKPVRRFVEYKTYSKAGKMWMKYLPFSEETFMLSLMCVIAKKIKGENETHMRTKDDVLYSYLNIYLGFCFQEKNKQDFSGTRPKNYNIKNREEMKNLEWDLHKYVWSSNFTRPDFGFKFAAQFDMFDEKRLCFSANDVIPIKKAIIKYMV